jgi:CarD family transcriptional regulator
LFKVGEYVVYRRDVCKLIGINHNNSNDCYYILIPVLDNSLKIEVPISNKNGSLRPLINKERVNEIIKKIPDVEVLNCDDSRLIESEYKTLINSGELIDLVKIIKTTYLRNKEKVDKKRKTNDMDNTYFNLAEKYLYQEFSIVLDMSYDDTKRYIIEKVNKLCKSRK